MEFVRRPARRNGAASYEVIAIVALVATLGIFVFFEFGEELKAWLWTALQDVEQMDEEPGEDEAFAEAALPPKPAEEPSKPVKIEPGDGSGATDPEVLVSSVDPPSEPPYRAHGDSQVPRVVIGDPGFGDSPSAGRGDDDAAPQTEVVPSTSASSPTLGFDEYAAMPPEERYAHARDLVKAVTEGDVDVHDLTLEERQLLHDAITRLPTPEEREAALAAIRDLAGGPFCYSCSPDDDDDKKKDDDKPVMLSPGWGTLFGGLGIANALAGGLRDVFGAGDGSHPATIFGKPGAKGGDGFDDLTGPDADAIASRMDDIRGRYDPDADVDPGGDGSDDDDDATADDPTDDFWYPIKWPYYWARDVLSPDPDNVFPTWGDYGTAAWKTLTEDWWTWGSSGAAYGAGGLAVGSAVPVIGNIGGAIGGAVIGGGGSFFDLMRRNAHEIAAARGDPPNPEAEEVRRSLVKGLADGPVAVVVSPWMAVKALYDGSSWAWRKTTGGESFPEWRDDWQWWADPEAIVDSGFAFVGSFDAESGHSNWRLAPAVATGAYTLWKAGPRLIEGVRYWWDWGRSRLGRGGDRPPTPPEPPTSPVRPERPPPTPVQQAQANLGSAEASVVAAQGRVDSLERQLEIARRNRTPGVDDLEKDVAAAKQQLEEATEARDVAKQALAEAKGETADVGGGAPGRDAPETEAAAGTATDDLPGQPADPATSPVAAANQRLEDARARTAAADEALAEARAEVREAQAKVDEARTNLASSTPENRAARQRELDEAEAALEKAAARRAKAADEASAARSNEAVREVEAVHTASGGPRRQSSPDRPASEADQELTTPAESPAPSTPSSAPSTGSTDGRERIRKPVDPDKERRRRPVVGEPGSIPGDGSSGPRRRAQGDPWRQTVARGAGQARDRARSLYDTYVQPQLAQMRQAASNAGTSARNGLNRAQDGLRDLYDRIMLPRTPGPSGPFEDPAIRAARELNGPRSSVAKPADGEWGEGFGREADLARQISEGQPPRVAPASVGGRPVDWADGLGPEVDNARALSDGVQPPSRSSAGYGEVPDDWHDDIGQPERLAREANDARLGVATEGAPPPEVQLAGRPTLHSFPYHTVTDDVLRTTWTDGGLRQRAATVARSLNEYDVDDVHRLVMQGGEHPLVEAVTNFERAQARMDMARQFQARARASGDEAWASHNREFAERYSAEAREHLRAAERALDAFRRTN